MYLIPYLKKVLLLFLGILLFIGIVSPMSLAEEESEEKVVELSVNVPFGITTGKAPIPVLDQARKGHQIDTLLPTHICAVDKGEEISAGENDEGEKWYHIYYLNDDGMECVGTISGECFELFTIESLVLTASDPENMAVINALLALPEISATAGGQTTHDVDMSGIGFSRNQAIGEDSPLVYVLNTKKRKIHRPTCESVDKIKLKNRKDIFAAEDVIPYIKEKEYEGCKNCNPILPDY